MVGGRARAFFRQEAEGNRNGHEAGQAVRGRQGSKLETAAIEIQSGKRKETLRHHIDLENPLNCVKSGVISQPRIHFL